MKHITKQNACHICRAKPDKWGKDTEWVYGYYVHLDKDWIFYWDETNPLGDKMVMVEIDPDTLCRCTGKQDEDGVWMFEKDKVDCVGDWWAGVITWQSAGAIGWCIEKLYGDKEEGRYGLNSGYNFKITGNTIEK